MIVSFYTPKYSDEAKELLASAQQHGYDVELVPVEEAGSWAANCAKKAQVCRDALDRYEQILFLDADARVLASIDELLKPHDGIRLHIVKPKDFKKGWFAQRYRYHAVRHGGMWNSGIMSIRRSPEVMQLMDAWVEMCARRPTEWDQLSLQWTHIESRSTVSVTDIPAEYRAGGSIIGHKSAFHRHWKKPQDRPKRKVLLVGSADYLPQWWEENRQPYLNEGFQVVAVNNACHVVGDDCHLWLIPNDYKGQFRADHVPNNHPRYPRATNREGNWITKPFWQKVPSTIVFSALYHLLNEAKLDDCRLEVHLAGCDMMYSNGQTHFYGTGPADPLRFSEGQLKQAQLKIERAYKSQRCSVFNAGGQEQTRLIFPRV